MWLILQSLTRYSPQSPWQLLHRPPHLLLQSTVILHRPPHLLLQSTVMKERHCRNYSTRSLDKQGHMSSKLIASSLLTTHTHGKGSRLQLRSSKLSSLLQSQKPEEYCLGVAKLQKKDKKELQEVLKRFAAGTTWRFTAVKLLDDKSAFIHTTCRITIDLRKTTTTAMLQSRSFPRTPCPTTTIADILKLKQMQRFDLMAIPDTILAERRSGTGQIIADVRLTDGSKDPRDKTDAPANATIPSKKQYTAPMRKPFRCKLQINATEHGE